MRVFIRILLASMLVACAARADFPPKNLPVPADVINLANEYIVSKVGKDYFNAHYNLSFGSSCTIGQVVGLNCAINYKYQNAYLGRPIDVVLYYNIDSRYDDNAGRDVPDSSCEKTICGWMGTIVKGQFIEPKVPYDNAMKTAYDYLSVLSDQDLVLPIVSFEDFLAHKTTKQQCAISYIPYGQQGATDKDWIWGISACLSTKNPKCTKNYNLSVSAITGKVIAAKQFLYCPEYAGFGMANAGQAKIDVPQNIINLANDYIISKVGKEYFDAHYAISNYYRSACDVLKGGNTYCSIFYSYKNIYLATDALTIWLSYNTGLPGFIYEKSNGGTVPLTDTKCKNAICGWVANIINGQVVEPKVDYDDAVRAAYDALSKLNDSDIAFPLPPVEDYLARKKINHGHCKTASPGRMQSGTPDREWIWGLSMCVPVKKNCIKYYNVNVSAVTGKVLEMNARDLNCPTDWREDDIRSTAQPWHFRPL